MQFAGLVGPWRDKKTLSCCAVFIVVLYKASTGRKLKALFVVKCAQGFFCVVNGRFGSKGWTIRANGDFYLFEQAQMGRIE